MILTHSAEHDGSESRVVIAGGGIGGLAMALTLHQIGVRCIVLEAVSAVRPLGVGINLQPNAVRELYDLGFTDNDLGAIGVRCREWTLLGLNGNQIYAEPRGLAAGYKWPQYSVHRGALHKLLYQTVCDRLGAQAVRTGHRVTGYSNHATGVAVQVETQHGAQTLDGALLIGADGIHSMVRAQMYPAQPPIHWGGAIMWRGVSAGAPVRTGASFVGIGSHRQRVVFYPITPPDPQTGLATINWIAEITVDNSAGLPDGNWTRQADARDVAARFAGWEFDWLNVPAMISAADEVFEYPMIDRDPVPAWQDGNVALLGDAAHPMYPTGSNGASQAIVDARVLGQAMLEHGITARALVEYNQKLCADVSAVVLRNRGAGPFAILGLVDERCGGVFDNIEDVVKQDEMEAVMAGYKKAAGLALDTLNAQPPIIPAGARVIGERR